MEDPARADGQHRVDDSVDDAELAGIATSMIPETDLRILRWRDAGMCWVEIADRLGTPSADSARKAHARSLLRVRAALMKVTE